MECQVMRMAKRAIIRLALVGWLGLTGLVRTGGESRPGRDTPGTGPPRLDRLPASRSTMSRRFREAFRQSQYGQLWNDPAMKDFRDDLAAKLEGRQQRRSRRRSASRSRSSSSCPRGAGDRRRRQRRPQAPGRPGDHRRRRQERGEDGRGHEPKHQAGRGRRRQGVAPRPSRG